MKLFSVAICTWNRSQLLDRTLQSLAQCVGVDKPDWDLIIVDNNCTDDTAAVCRKWSDQLPIRVEMEHLQGHSHSRNRAIAASTSQWILWTDDDVLVSSQWLEAYRHAMTEHSQAGFFGGPIQLHFLDDVPGWVESNREVAYPVFAYRDLGSEPRLLDLGSLPFGANFATRRELHEQYRFRSEFGRVGLGVRGYDEIDVLERMVAGGQTGWWVPQAKLRHMIPRSRTTIRYVADYFFGQGQTWVVRGKGDPDPDSLRQLIRHHYRRYLVWRALGRSRRWFIHLVQHANLRGQLSALTALRSQVAGGGSNAEGHTG